jgi:hypothetical protein
MKIEKILLFVAVPFTEPSITAEKIRVVVWTKFTHILSD